MPQLPSGRNIAIDSISMQNYYVMPSIRATFIASRR